MMRWFPVLAALLLSACQVAPTLEVTGSTVAPSQRYESEVALVMSPASRSLSTPILLPTGCLVGGVAINAQYGEIFHRAVMDRLGRMFARVVPVSSMSEASAYPLAFEAELNSVGYKLGCLISPETYVLVTASLRAIDPQGREGWRSPTANKRAELALMMMDVDRGLGEPTSRAMGGLADDWLRDLSGLGPERMAALAGSPVTPAAQARPVALGRTATASPAPAAPTVTAPPPPRFPAAPVATRFLKGPERPDDVAVIIGNADYRRQARDVPDVKPAYADAEGVRLYAQQSLGIKDGNVIFLKDATGAQMTRVFGSERDARGQLFDWVKPGRSRVFVYYSGHGAPGSGSGGPYLVPADADAARIELNGYPLKQLYDNLGKLPAESVTVVLEACFSGLSPAGSVLGKASPVFFEVKAPPVPAGLTVITAGAADQMASWDQDESAGLFTRYFLEAMTGKGDANKDGRVSLEELQAYLKDTLTYQARRHYGRDQSAQVVKGGQR